MSETITGNNLVQSKIYVLLFLNGEAVQLVNEKTTASGMMRLSLQQGPKIDPCGTLVRIKSDNVNKVLGSLWHTASAYGEVTV